MRELKQKHNQSGLVHQESLKSDQNSINFELNPRKRRQRGGCEEEGSFEQKYKSKEEEKNFTDLKTVDGKTEERDFDII